MPLPDCFDCKYGGGEFPCRKSDSTFDFDKAGAAIIAVGRLYADMQPSGTDEPPDVPDAIAWITDCEYELVQDHAQLVLPLIIAASDACETPRDAAFLAAGLVENAIVKHGPQLIDRVEALAQRSEKFRYILSGMWSQNGSVDAEVWARIGRVIGTGARMSNDVRDPPGGSSVHVLDGHQVLELMKQRVADSAKGLDL